MLKSGAPACDVLARIDEDRRDHAAHLRRHVNALDRPESADCRDTRRPGLGFRHRHRNACRRRRRLGDEAFDHPRLEDELHIGEPADEAGKKNKDTDKQEDAFHSGRLAMNFS